jgi:meiotically up-regulated gene 157 (Mug157) protein
VTYHFQAFLTPANAMLSVELEFLAEIMDAVGHGSSDITSSARTLGNRIKHALWDTTVSILSEHSVMS